MAIVNRDLDGSEQHVEVTAHLGAVATGTTAFLFHAPWPCTLKYVRAAAQGVSNAMQVAFEKLSIGSSGIPMGISNLVLQNYSVSGSVAYSGLAAAGATVLKLSAGDVIKGVTSVANGNATDLVLTMVLQKTQDIVSNDF